MADASIKVVGLKDIKKNIDGVVKLLGNEIEATFQDWGNETVKDARTDHDFKRETGEADKSIQAKAKGASVKVWINPERVTVNNKWVYPALLHEGTKRGIKKDPFLDRAVDRNLDKAEKAVTKKVMELFK